MILVRFSGSKGGGGDAFGFFGFFLFLSPVRGFPQVSFVFQESCVAS